MSNFSSDLMKVFKQRGYSYWDVNIENKTKLELI
jgi:hypothetical protein